MSDSICPITTTVPSKVIGIYSFQSKTCMCSLQSKEIPRPTTMNDTIYPLARYM